MGMTVATISDPPPRAVSEELDRLSADLRTTIPPRRLDENLLVATWNIRAFGDLTEKWKSSDDDSPKRDLGSVLCIAEIVSRFDVVAIQEVKDNLKGLRDLMRVLGSDWGLIMTDTNEGGVGNSERMAYVFDTRRVKPSGLAGELVVPPEWRDTTGRDLASGQFARTPYAVSFISHGQTFVLVTLHVLYGDRASERAGELRAIAEWMARWAKQEESWGHNLIALGDFNLDRIGDPNFEAFTSTGLRPPRELESLPRTIFAEAGENYYDQIAWFTTGGAVPILSLKYTGTAGNFDFTQSLRGELSLTALSWKISDHYPLWAEFSVVRE